MNSGEYGRLRQELIEELKLVARDRGVERDDDQLLALLTGRLRTLCHAWGIDPSKGAAAARADIRARLDEHLSEITPVELRPGVNSPHPKLRGAQRKTQFERVVRAVFNTAPGLAYGLSETGTEDRLTWLTTPANRHDGIDYSLHPSAARRDYEYARNKIAEQLARCLADAGERTTSSDTLLATNSDSDSETPSATQDELVPDSIEAPTLVSTSTSKDVDKGRKKQRILWAFGLLVIVAAGLVTASLSGAFNKTPSRAATSWQPPVVSSTSGPVIVTNATYVRDDGTPGAWSYAFPKMLSTSDVASYSAVSQNAQQFQQWAFSKGGVTTGDARLQITLRGNYSDAVHIAYVKVTSHCGRPLSGTLIYRPGEGKTSGLGLNVDLDQIFPEVEYPNSHAIYFDYGGNAPHTITLTHGQVATILLDAVTSQYYCKFSFSLQILTDTEEVIETVDDHGKPFQVTAAAGVGSSIPFSSYHDVYIQNSAGNGLVSKIFAASPSPLPSPIVIP